jgi:hypothetical protein
VSSRIQFDPPNPVPAEENEEVIFFNDGTIRVTQKAIFIGSPHNQAFSISQVIGVSHFKKGEGIGTIFGVLVSLVGFVISAVLLATHNYVLCAIFGAFALYVLTQSLTFDWQVALQFGGLNNQTLTMRSQKTATELSEAIMRAISHLPLPPPSGGEPVAYQPYFPNPVNSRN